VQGSKKDHTIAHQSLKITAVSQSFPIAKYKLAEESKPHKGQTLADDIKHQFVSKQAGQSFTLAYESHLRQAALNLE
jgi:hypothetical protein